MKHLAKPAGGSYPLQLLFMIGIIAFLSASKVYGTDYYFSSKNGNDANSVSTSSTPWQSIAKLQSVINQLQAGDVIYLERGSVWYEASLTMQSKDGYSGAPIKIMAYGSGERPVLSGGRNLTGTFTNSNNLWTSTGAGFVPHDYIITPGGMLINNKFYAISRTPNTTYLWTPSKGNGSLTDATQSWSTNELAGGQVVARCVGWAWSTATITSNTSNQIIFNNFIDFDLGAEAETAYFLQNLEQGTDLPGEWCFNNDNVKIYSVGNLNQKEVEFPVKDTLIRLDYCDYVDFEGIEFRSVNAVLMDIQEGSHVTIDDCAFRVSGWTAIDVNNTHNFDVTGSDFEYIHGNGITADYLNVANINDNYFYRTPATRGAWNYPPSARRVGSAVTCYYGDGPVYVRNNVFDSVMIGFQSHWSDYSYWFENNLIKDYGIITADCGGVYLGGDWRVEIKKYIRKNIFIDAHENTVSTTGTHLSRYVHAIYWDYDTRGAVCDSNTIINTNGVVYSNKATGNTFRGNNVYDGCKDVTGLWSANIYMDGNWGGTSGPGWDTIINNTFVFGQHPDQRGYLWHNVTDGGFQINNNTYINPFNSNTKIHKEVDFYVEQGNYSIQEYCSRKGFDCNSTFNPLDWKFSSVTPGEISADEFVNVVYNASNNPKYVKLSAEYIDVNGTHYRDSVLVKPWYSKILFYYSKVEDVNDKPLINNRVISIQEDDFSGTQIVDLEVSDPDVGQSHTFAITAGNSSGLFTIQPSTGILSFTTSSINFEGNPVYPLTIQVTDNGVPALSDQATVTVQLFATVAVDENHAPQILAQSFITNYDVSTPSSLGYVEASDADDGQQLDYSIVSGNMDGHFEIDEYTGELSVVSLPADNQPVTYNLIIRVADDASNSLTAEATITVYISASDKVFYIDPENTGDASADGSYDHPFASWANVEWQEEATYLQKCGTVANEDKIIITARGVTLGDYGSGDKPIINSSADDYSIKAIDKDKITIKNLKVNSELAIGCIYFLGPNCIDNAIENCELVGADYGLRMIDGASYIVKYNVFQNRVDGIYSIAEDAEIYYNVFKGNYKAVNLGSYSSYAKIYNNVFYDNREGVSSSYAEITLFNNIFYMTHAGDQAINYKLDKLVSNNNIFFPEQEGFLEIKETSYSNLADFQKEFGLDMNSFVQDPQFVDVYENNFSVDETSRAIDAGRLVGLTQDFLGQQVPYGTGPDIGTVEIPSEPQMSSIDYAGSDVKVNFSIYPNPTQGRINIKFQNNQQGTKEISVYSVKGQLVYTETLDISGNFVTEVSLDDQPAGVYYVSIKSGDEMLMQKVIKN